MNLWLLSLLSCNAADRYPPDRWESLADGGSRTWATADPQNVVLDHVRLEDQELRQLRLWIDTGYPVFGGRPDCEVAAGQVAGTHACAPDGARDLVITEDGANLELSFRGGGWPSYVSTTVKLTRVSPVATAFHVFRPYAASSPETAWIAEVLPNESWPVDDLEAAIVARGANPATVVLDSALCLRKELDGALMKVAASRQMPAIDPEAFREELRSSALDDCVWSPPRP